MLTFVSMTSGMTIGVTGSGKDNLMLTFVSMTSGMTIGVTGSGKDYPMLTFVSMTSGMTIGGVSMTSGMTFGGVAGCSPQRGWRATECEPGGCLPHLDSSTSGFALLPKGHNSTTELKF